jgi:peptidoglycan/LPS O-acetylase OafA/YrhL
VGHEYVEAKLTCCTIKAFEIFDGRKGVVSFRRFESIQALRALAALGVVAFHTNGNVLAYGWFPHFFARVSRFGEIGVDVFFVISGFIMVFVTHGQPSGIASARSFISARISRIVPLYWLLTILFILLLVTVPNAFGNAHFNAWNALTSFVFFPSLNWEGITAPVVGVGWTLNYEMWFYLVFAIAMCATRHRVLAAGTFLALTSLMRLLPDGGVVHQFYTNPIVLEFVFGCCVGVFYTSGRTISLPIALAFLLGTAVAVTAFAPTLTEANRFLKFGLPALAVFIVGLSLESKVRWNALLERIGDSSYSLYLTHFFSVPIAVKLLRIVDQQHRISGDVICVVVVLISTVVGLVAYRALERPLGRWVRGCPVLRRTAV